MTAAHWLALGATALFVCCLALAASRVRPGSRAHRALSRAVSGALSLAVASMLLPRLGVNGVSLAAALLLGAPGTALLAFLTL